MAKNTLLFLTVIVASFIANAQDWRATVPYFCDFEDHVENGAWMLMNGDSAVVNKWYIDSAAGSANGGYKSLYISDSSGSIYRYDNSAPSCVIAYREFTLAEGSHIVSYEWKGIGEQGFDVLIAALVPEWDTTLLLGGTTLPAGVSTTTLPEGWINLGGETGLSGTAEWHRQETYIDVTVSGNYKLVFIWRNDYADGSDRPAAIDNVRVREVTCLRPEGLTAEEGITSVTLTWNGSGSIPASDMPASQWIISYDDSNEYVTSTPTYTINGLEPGTTYTFSVKAVCGEGDTSLPAAIAAVTGFVVPYYENFDSIVGDNPLGWRWVSEGESEDSTQLSDAVGYNVSGGRLVIDGDGYAVLPLLDARIDTLQLRFNHSTPYRYNDPSTGSGQDNENDETTAGNSPSQWLVVGVMEDSGFVAVDTIADPLGESHRKTIYYNSYTGTGGRLAFRNYGDGTQGSVHYIDNVRVEYLPSCFPAAEVWATADSESVRIEWREVMNQGMWEVTLTDPSTSSVQAVTVQQGGDTAIFSGLEGNHSYRYSIRAICSESDSSEALTGQVRTECRTVPHSALPYQYGFEDEEGEGLCWEKHANENQNSPSTGSGQGNSIYEPYASWGVAWRGNQSCVLPSGENAYSWVVMPEFQDDVNSLMVTMWMRGEGRLLVGVMEDAGDGSTFVSIDTIVNSGSEWEFFEVPLTNYSGTGRRISIRREAGMPGSAYIDDVGVEMTPSCSRVRSLESEVVTAGAALMSWGSGRIGEYMGAVIGVSEAESDTWSVQSSSSMETLLTGLLQNTEYEIRVAAVCEGGDTSLWSELRIMTAMTNCNSVDLTTEVSDTISGLTISNNYETPVNNWYNYSFSEQLYTAGEMDTVGTIMAIEYYFANDTLTMSGKDSCEIYIGVTTLENLSIENHLEPRELTLVYRGELNCTGGWNRFDFNEGYFSYDGRSNLVIAVVDNSGAAHDNRYRFACHASSGKAIAFYSDEERYDNYLMMSREEVSFRNNIILHRTECSVESECYPPTVIVGDIEASQVSLRIIPGGNENAWSIYQREMGDSTYSIVATTSQQNYTLSELEPSTTYSIRVVGDCDDDPTSEFNITTRCQPLSVPFVEDFTSWPTGPSPLVPSCWSKKSSLGVNVPYIYPWTVGGHESVLYLYSNEENHSLVAMPELEPAIDSLQLSFYLYRESNSGNQQSDHPLVVGVMNNVGDFETFHPLHTVVVQGENEWRLIELTFDTLAKDSTLSTIQFEALRHGRIVLLSPDSIYSRPFIDDIVVDYIPRCQRPTAITINQSLSTADSICFAWDGAGSNAGFILSIDSNEYYSANDHTLVGGLNAAMVYSISVRGICEEYSPDNQLLWRDTSEATSVQLRTPCGKISHSPWVESFEQNAVSHYFSHTFAKCWSRISDSANYFGNPLVSDDKVYNRDCHSGDRGLAWSASPDELYGDYQYIVTPEIDTAHMPLNELQLSFWTHAQIATQTPVFEVGVLNNGDSSGASFVAVDTIVISGVTAWQKHTVYFNSYQGNGTHIAIKATRPEAAWEASIDDVEIRLIPLCPPVSNIVASNIDTSTLTVTWTDHSTALAWDVEYGPHGFAMGTGVQLYTTTTAVTLTGLASSTLYDIYVRPVCGDDATFVMASISTADTYYDIPFVCNFNDPTEYAKWRFANGQHVNAWTIGNALGNGDNSSLYISQDNGATNSYDRDVTGISYAYVNLSLADTGNYNYRFDWRSNGESQFDYLRVALVPISFLPQGIPSGFSASSLPLDWMPLDGGHQLYGDTTGWTTIESEIHVTTPGIYRMLFAWIDNYIAIGHQSPAAIDNVVFRHTSCQTPTDLSTIPYDDSVTVSWTPSGDESAWIITCDTVSTIVYSTQHTITELTANSDYQVTVRAFCIEGDTSMAASKSFHTTCHPVALPYVENFDSHTTSTTAFTGFLPDCWSETVIGNQGTRTAQLYYGSDNAHSGNYSLFMGKEAYVAMPPMPVPLNELQLTFHHLINMTGYGLEVGVMEGDNFIPIVSYMDPDETYIEHTLLLSAYAGASRIIAFHNTNPISIGSPNFIDDITIDFIPECLPVTDITAPITSTDAIHLDWTENSPAASWQIVYGLSGFAPGSGDTITATAHPVAITELDSLTSYDFYVRGFCNDTLSSDWTGPIQFSTSYCDDATVFSTGQSNLSSPYLPLSTGYRYSATEIIIDSAELSALGDISAIAFFYSDSEAMTVKDSVTIWLQPTSLTSFANDNSFIALSSSAVQLYSGSLNCHAGWNYFTFENNYVWDGVNNLVLIIDDNSGVYELTDPQFSTVQCSGQKSISYRSMTNNIDPASPLAFYGQKNRYNYRPVMQLISCGGAVCHEPIDLATITIGWDSATIAWRGTSENFEVALRKDNESNWSEPVNVISSTNMGSHTFHGLEEMTLYYYRVRQTCNTGNISEWAEDSFITGLRPCMAPSAVLVEDVTYDQATISWTSNNEQTIHYLKLNNGAVDTVIVVSDNPFIITELAQGITYTVAVADSCTNNGSLSEYSESVNFTTLTCAPVNNVAVTDITATQAVVTWEGESPAYYVEYGEGNFNEGMGIIVDDISGTMLTLTELVPETEYTVFVRSKCSSNSYSIWSQRLSFRTSTLGIDAPKDSGFEILVSPNPASETVTIEIEGLENDAELTIIDMSGRAVMEKKIIRRTPMKETQTVIRVDDIAEGSYLVCIRIKEQIIVRKLIVKR